MVWCAANRIPLPHRHSGATDADSRAGIGKMRSLRIRSSVKRGITETMCLDKGNPRKACFSLYLYQAKIAKLLQQASKHASQLTGLCFLVSYLLSASKSSRMRTCLFPATQTSGYA